MHLDTDQTLRRHLVAADDSDDVMESEVAPPAVVLMAAVATLITLVVIMAMCVCHKKRLAKKEAGELVNQEVVPLEEGQLITTDVITPSPVEDTDVKLTVVDTRSSRHSNGSVVMGKEAAENGRPKSHDQRALPEIPAGPLSNGVMQTDDEDDEEGHYDIISRHRAMAASVSAASVETTDPQPSPGMQNLYEKVVLKSPRPGGGPIAGSAPGSVAVGAEYSAPVRSMNPYATVEGIGRANATHIEEKGNRRGGVDGEPASVPKVSVAERAKAISDAQSGASTDTLNESYASVPPPPVPDKHFVNPDSTAGLLNLNELSTVSPQNSPGLRAHSMALALDEIDGLPLASSIDSIDEGPAMAINPEQSESTTGKREPPYSSVTARESLANLRQRHAIERQQLQPLPHDATYESVNYAHITSPAVANLNTMTSDRNSVTSDLYAEIASGSGENSTRSSVYAKVGDVSEVMQYTPAPTLPPMDFLKHLPKEAAKNDDEMPDPGYSIIRRARPASAYTVTQPQPQSPNSEDSDGQPVYAVVLKSRRNRNTVCVSTDVNSNVALQNGGSEDSGGQLYAQVNKQRGGNTDLDLTQSLLATAYAGTGARPKVERNSGAVTNNNPNGLDAAVSGVRVRTSGCSSDMDSTYQTIRSDLNSADGTGDPAYEDIVQHNQITEHNLASEIDPNYECVHTESMAQMLSRMASPGVATEISAGDLTNHPHGLVHINDHHVDATFWQRPEHVYQEIGSTQHPHLDHRMGDHPLHTSQNSRLEHCLLDHTLHTHTTPRTQLDHRHMADHTLHQITTDL